MKLIGFQIVNVLDAGVDQHFEAVNARRMSNANSSVFYARTILGCLCKSIHLRGTGSEAVFFRFSIGCFGLIDEAAGVGAVGHTCRRAVVTSGEDVLIPDDNRTNLSAGTGRTFRDLLRYGHEVLIPA